MCVPGPGTPAVYRELMSRPDRRAQLPTLSTSQCCSAEHSDAYYSVPSRDTIDVRLLSQCHCPHMTANLIAWPGTVVYSIILTFNCMDDANPGPFCPQNPADTAGHHK